MYHWYVPSIFWDSRQKIRPYLKLVMIWCISYIYIYLYIYIYICVCVCVCVCVWKTGLPGFIFFEGLIKNLPDFFFFLLTIIYECVCACVCVICVILFLSSKVFIIYKEYMVSISPWSPDSPPLPPVAIYIYIYIYMCVMVCVCVCVWFAWSYFYPLNFLSFIKSISSISS